MREMLTDPATLLGLSDGGAHCGLDLRRQRAELHADALGARPAARGREAAAGMAGQAPDQRDRRTSSASTTAAVLAPGMKADVNVIDFERLRLHTPEIVYDLPAGGQRLVQRVDGYEATIVSGQPIFEDGEDTGAMPGKLVRAGRR